MRNILPPLTIYPKKIPKNYSGCAYAWFEEDDNKDKLFYSVARYENGKVTEGMNQGLLEPTMVYCRPGDQATQEESCRMFDKFWEDASNSPPPEEEK